MAQIIPTQGTWVDADIMGDVMAIAAMPRTDDNIVAIKQAILNLTKKTKEKLVQVESLERLGYPQRNVSGALRTLVKKLGEYYGALERRQDALYKQKQALIDYSVKQVARDIQLQIQEAKKQEAIAKKEAAMLRRGVAKNPRAKSFFLASLIKRRMSQPPPGAMGPPPGAMGPPPGAMGPPPGPMGPPPGGCQG